MAVDAVPLSDVCFLIAGYGLAAMAAAITHEEATNCNCETIVAALGPVVLAALGYSTWLQTAMYTSRCCSPYRHVYACMCR